MRVPRLRSLVSLTCSVAVAVVVALGAGAQSAEARPSDAPLVCSVSPALASLPFTASPKDPGNPVYDFMQFTATRNGTYAGIAYRSASGDFYLVSRAPGKALVVLRKVHYPYAHATPNAVTAMGYTPSMNLVVAVQNTWYQPTGIAFGSYKGMYFTGRTGHYLAAGRHWISYMPTAVAANTGRVVGWAATGSATQPHYYIVTWPSVGAAPVVLADVGRAHPSVQMTANGDIAWQGPDGYSVVRRADGSRHELNVGTHAQSAGIWPAAASQNSFYAPATNGVFRWVVSPQASAGTALQGSRMTTSSSLGAWIDTVGPRGDMVTGQITAIYHAVDGRQIAMPAQALPASAQSRVISSNGVIAFTSAKDRKVHLMTCR